MFVTDLNFRCNKCGTTWALHLDVPLRNAQDVIDFLRVKMPPCPADCGGNTADVAFKIGGKP